MNLEFLTELGLSEELSGKIMAQYDRERLDSALEQELKRPELNALPERG